MRSLTVTFVSFKIVQRNTHRPRNIANLRRATFEEFQRMRPPAGGGGTTWLSKKADREREREGESESELSGPFDFF